MLASKLAQFEIEVMALEFTALRLLSANQSSRVPAVEASMLKVRGTELRQGIHALLVDIAGPARCRSIARATCSRPPARAGGRAGAAGTGRVGGQLPDARKLSIYGGVNEVQRNLISKAFLAA